MQINPAKISSPNFKGSYIIEKIGRENPDSVFDMELHFMRNAEFYDDYSDYKNIKLTITCPDDFDEKIESFMLANNIKFKKYTQEELFGHEQIFSRMIKDPHYSMGTLKTVNLEKFSKMWAETDPELYLAPNEDDRQQQGVKDFIRTGQKIHAPNACITEYKNGPTLCICDGRHRLAVFKGIGMEKIKVNFIDENSLKLVQKYGLLAE